MVRAYQGFPAFEDGSNVRAWLFTILHNTWNNNYRKAARRPVEKLDGDFSDPVAVMGAPLSSTQIQSAELEALQSMRDGEVCDALQSLLQPQRLVVFLADVEGFKYREIAEMVDAPLGTVMSRLHRGRRAMRNLLVEYAIKKGHLRDRSDLLEVAAA